ncbi:efflux RND transporter permease subunit, partial [Chloroflexota bacterium]
MTWLTKIALKKRWLTFLIVAIVTGASIWSTLNLQMELIPDIELPVTSVITVYPQAKPETVMNDVTVKVESAISGLKGLDQIVSTASEGSTFTFAMFDYGTDMAETNRLIEENLAALELPAAVRDLPINMPQLKENPQLYAINTNMMPIVILSITGDLPPSELEQIAETQIMPALEQVEGVYHVSTEGGSSQQVIVNLDPRLLNDAGLSMSGVAAALSSQGYDSITQLENTPLDMSGVILKDVGGAELGLPSASSVSRTNGKTSISINIQKEAESNTVFVANAVMDEVDDITASLPDDLILYTVMDQSEYIETSISDLSRNALIGCGLAIIVVFFFLMAFRASLVTAVSIPLSILIGFLIMRFLGITINLLTLSAMAIAVGRVIDNSIVVLEVIYRKMQDGEPFRTASLGGVKEVAAPITSSTLATVVIFIPMAFVGGIVGEMFIPFALTMTAALIASLIVALMVIPPLSNFPVVKKDSKGDGQAWYQRLYLPVLKWSLGHRALTLVIATVLFFGSFTLVPLIGTSFIPAMGEKMLTVDVTMPRGTDLATTENAVIKVEKILVTHPDITTIQTNAGTSGSISGGFMALGSAGDSTASIIVFLEREADMELTAADVREDLIGIIPEADITVTTGQAMSGGMSGSGLDISVRGDSYEDLAATAQQLYAELSDVDGIAELKLGLATVEPKLDIAPDPAKLMTSGLPMEQLTQIQQDFFLMQVGGIVSQAVVDGHNYEVYLNGIAQNLDSAEVARELRVGFPQSVKLGDIANVELGEQQTNIQRINEKLAASITASITAKNIGAVNMAVQKKIDSLDTAPGVDISQGGTIEMMQESFSGMFIAIIVAIVLAFAVIAVTFRSLLTPIVIMISLPLASIGALLGLLLAGQTLGISAMMGVLMLVGIVLTNAIVLIDLVERLRKQGMSIHDALVESGRTRMRPILMTALTTMIAMLPLALGLGEGTIISAELAIVVIGGLFSSTLLTLLVIPVMYSLVKGRQQQKTAA